MRHILLFLLAVVACNANSQEVHNLVKRAKIAISSGCLSELTHLVIYEGLSPDSRYNTKGTSLLHLAAQKKDDLSFAAFLLEQGACPDI